MVNIIGFRLLFPLICSSVWAKAFCEVSVGKLVFCSAMCVTSFHSCQFEKRLQVLNIFCSSDLFVELIPNSWKWKECTLTPLKPQQAGSLGFGHLPVHWATYYLSAQDCFPTTELWAPKCLDLIFALTLSFWMNIYDFRGKEICLVR